MLPEVLLTGLVYLLLIIRLSYFNTIVFLSPKVNYCVQLAIEYNSCRLLIGNSFLAFFKMRWTEPQANVNSGVCLCVCSDRCFSYHNLTCTLAVAMLHFSHPYSLLTGFLCFLRCAGLKVKPSLSVNGVQVDLTSKHSIDQSIRTVNMKFNKVMAGLKVTVAPINPNPGAIVEYTAKGMAYRSSMGNLPSSHMVECIGTNEVGSVRWNTFLKVSQYGSRSRPTNLLLTS